MFAATIRSTLQIREKLAIMQNRVCTPFYFVFENGQFKVKVSSQHLFNSAIQKEKDDNNFRLLIMMALMMMLVMTFTQIFFSLASSPCSAEPVVAESCLRSKPRPEC